MKTGANISDQKRIARHYAAGWTPDQISRKLKINLICVSSFNPEKVKVAKKKTKAKNKKSQAEHTAIMAVKTMPDIASDAPVPESE